MSYWKYATYPETEISLPHYVVFFFFAWTHCLLPTFNRVLGSVEIVLQTQVSGVGAKPSNSADTQYHL